MTQAEARERVARGAAHLDQVRPGWERRIDIGTLALHDPCGCIVGQLVPEHRGAIGAFYFGLKDLGIFGGQPVAATMGLVISSADSHDYPPLQYPNPVYPLLQDAWIDAIADRLHPVESVEPAPSYPALIQSRESATPIGSATGRLSS